MTTRARLLELVGAFAGWRYSRDRVGYPWTVPGCHVPLVAEGAPSATNCCCFVEAITVELFGLPWSRAQHLRAMCIGVDDRYGPADVLVAAGVADAVEPAGLGVVVVQGLRRDGGGHTFLVVDGAHILEANGGELRGVGWRGVGPAGASPAVPRSSGGWGWSRIRARYPDLRAARLRLTG